MRIHDELRSACATIRSYSDASRRLSQRMDRIVSQLALYQKVMLASLATTPSAQGGPLYQATTVSLCVPAKCE